MQPSSVFAAIVLAAGLPTAHAGIIAVSPFTGTMSETFESFPTGWTTDPVSIMGGQASFSISPGSPWAGILIQPQGQGLGTSGAAKPSDGLQYAYVNSYAPTGGATITFNTPVREFGAYWATPTGGLWGDPAIIHVRFLGDAGQFVDAVDFPYSHSSTGDGMLDWHGWESTIAFKSVVVTSTLQTMMDGLQATVPEPRTYALLAGTGLLAFAAFRRLSS